MIRMLGAACLASLLASAAGISPRSDAGLRVVLKSDEFQDELGEVQRGPDISTVTVSYADGLLGFHVGIPTHPTLTEDLRVRLFLDSDGDPGTGLTVREQRGVDHFLLVDRWELGLGAVGLFSCEDTTCSGGRDAAARGSLRFSYDGAATFSVDPADLDNPRLERLRFSVEAAAGIGFDPATRRYDFTDARWDEAPEQGDFWTFDARLLRVKSFSSTPRAPSAGERFALRLGALRTDTGAALTRGPVACSFRIAGKAVRPRSAMFVGQRAVCLIDVPRGTAGRRFRASIGVRLAGELVTRSVSGRIR